MEGRTYKNEYRSPRNLRWEEIVELLDRQYGYRFQVPLDHPRDKKLYRALKWLHKQTSEYEWTNVTVWIRDPKVAAMFKLIWII